MALASDERLAIDGGPAALAGQVPLWPPTDADVAAALAQAAADGSWGRYHGPHGARLSAAIAEFFGVEFVSLCCSGTFAVQLALRALRIGPGDEVLLAGYDFPGNFRSIEAVGAVPVVVDVDAGNWNFDPRQIPAACGPRTRAVVVSHLHGGLVPMRELVEHARELGLQVVEDASQAPGAWVEGRRAGNWGDVGVLSFGGTKLLTAGRGGALLTRSAEVHQRAKVFCEQGNHAYPLSEIQAAVLLPQLAKLDERNGRRTRSVESLRRRLAPSSGIGWLVNRAAGEPAYYKLGWKFLAGEWPCSRAEFVQIAQAEGIPIDTGFRGFALRGAKRCRRATELAQARTAADTGLVLHHPVLLAAEGTIEQLAAALEKVRGGVLNRFKVRADRA